MQAGFPPSDLAAGRRWAAKVRMARACQSLVEIPIYPDCATGSGLGIVDTGATVGNDCRIGKVAHLAPPCALAGNVLVGEGNGQRRDAVMRELDELGIAAAPSFILCICFHPIRNELLSRCGPLGFGLYFGKV